MPFYYAWPQAATLMNIKYMNHSVREIMLSEFPLAITLIALGYQPSSLDESSPHKVNFIFEETEAVQKVIEGYWKGSLLIEPKQFWNVSRELKSRIRSIK